MCVDVWHNQGPRCKHCPKNDAWKLQRIFRSSSPSLTLTLTRRSCRDSCPHTLLLHHAQAMLTGPGSYSESKENTVTFPEISTPILEKVLPQPTSLFYVRLLY